MERFGLERLAPALISCKLIDPMPTAESGDEYMRTRRAWGQRVNRIFSRSQPFPLEWRAVWLQCLPDDISKMAMRDCLAVYDVVDLRVPKFNPGPARSTPSCLGNVTREFGDFLAASGPGHNGSYDSTDDPAAVEKMLSEGAEAVLAMIRELTAVAAGTGRSVPALVGLFEKVKP